MYYNTHIINVIIIIEKIRLLMLMYIYKRGFHIYSVCTLLIFLEIIVHIIRKCHKTAEPPPHYLPTSE